MEAVKIEKAWKAINLHAKILCRGLYRTVYGSAVAGLIALSVYGYMSICKESGWTAVFEFVAACATLAIAIVNMYVLGRNKRGAKHG